MSVSKFGLLKLILREAMSAERLDRRPEPTSVMADPHNVDSFHKEGADRGALVPIYHFNALAVSSLLPYKGTVLDLGCGSGQFVRYFARCRPDCRIIGLDLSRQMVRVGNRALREYGLDKVARLDIGDMTHFSDQIQVQVDVVCSMFALHHLPSFVALNRCLEQIRTVQRVSGCGVWIFDHTRPRSVETAKVFPDLFTPEATQSFKSDSTNSLLASFSFRELSERIETASIGTFHHQCSRILRLYQIHWLSPNGWHDEKTNSSICSDTLSLREYKTCEQVKRLFSKKPF